MTVLSSRCGALALCLALGCGPEATLPPEIGATLCYAETGPGPRQPYTPAVYGADGERVHCVTEVNGFPAFSQDGCFPERMQATGLATAPGWSGDACTGESGPISPDTAGWEDIQCWYPDPDGLAAPSCYGLAQGRWFFARPPCTRREILDDPKFFELEVHEFCPGEDPALVPVDAFCSDEVAPDPDATVFLRGCLQPVGDVWVSLMTSCSVDAWVEPTPESDACQG
jgi:hypothetical protein